MRTFIQTSGLLLLTLFTTMIRADDQQALIRLNQLVSAPLTTYNQIRDFEYRILTDIRDLHPTKDLALLLTQLWNQPQAPVYGQLKVVEILQQFLNRNKYVDIAIDDAKNWLAFANWLSTLQPKMAFQASGQAVILSRLYETCLKSAPSLIHRTIWGTDNNKDFKFCQQNVIVRLEQIALSNAENSAEESLRKQSRIFLSDLIDTARYHSQVKSVLVEAPGFLSGYKQIVPAAVNGMTIGATLGLAGSSFTADCMAATQPTIISIVRNE